MTYIPINSPLVVDFQNMPKAELKVYFNCFTDSISGRILELTNLVKVSSGFESWEPDMTSNSLDQLGHWLATQIENRQRTKEEIEQIKKQLAFPVKIRQEDITSNAISIATDVGIYFGQTFIANYPLLRWDQLLGNKKYIDYGQPVIVGFGRVPLNSVRIVVTLARAIADGKQTGNRLKELYRYWEDQIFKTSSKKKRKGNL
jgi:hypothetical protein